MFEDCYEVILLWRSRRKLNCVESYWVKYIFCQLASISECDFTIKKRLIDIQSDDGACAIFHSHGWSTFGLKSAVSDFQNLRKSEAIITGVFHDAFS